jgi:hypothetical protein
VRGQRSVKIETTQGSADTTRNAKEKEKEKINNTGAIFARDRTSDGAGHAR